MVNGLGASTGVVLFQAMGTNLKLFFGATSATLNLVAYAYNPALTTGATGIIASKNAVLDNFTADQIIVPWNQSPPYNEAFAPNAPTDQLSNNWLERAGNFTFNLGMVGQAATNLATLNGISVTDIDVQGVFSLQTLNQSAGLISRFQNGSNMYFATVTLSAVGVYTVRINKTVNGVTTVIGQATTDTFSVPLPDGRHDDARVPQQ